jgi:hypothetical protein
MEDRQMKSLEDKRKCLLAQLGQETPFLAASLNRVKRTDKQGRTSEYHLLTYKEDGKTRSVYVPKEIRKEVSLWIRNHRKIKKLMADISTISIAIVRSHVPEKRAAAAKNRDKQNARQARPSRN